MSKKYHKSLPKFTRNNVITDEDHLDSIGVDMDDTGIEHEVL
jgi:hypothetical protein